MRRFTVSVHIDEQRWLQFYQRPGQVVIAHDDAGRRVQFPAEHLRSFVGHTGIDGRFNLVVDDDNRLLRIERA